MKNVLKIWLVDNTVTVDNKDDKIGQLESSGNLSVSYTHLTVISVSTIRNAIWLQQV